MYKKSIFIFRRDLRLYDNIGLIDALSASNEVIPIFIFTPEQLVNNKYKSDNAVQFMMESLEDLNKDLNKKKSRLHLFYGSPDDVISKLIKKYDINAVFANMDYTPYSSLRDNSIKKICEHNKIEFIIHEDALLHPVRTIKNGSGNVYTKFTPYFRSASKVKPDKPKKITKNNFMRKGVKLDNEYTKDIHSFYTFNENIAVRGGRKYGLDIIKNIKRFKNYNKVRNDLSGSTTKLSAYIRFGCLSIREIYYKIRQVLGTKNDLIKQLFWRDFYYNVAYEYPHTVAPKKQSLKAKYDKIKWNYDKKNLNKWKEGKTGFPVVDAAMRELNKTGFMHNRGRLIVSSFLVKILRIDWREGDKYFSQKLVDHDSIVNTSNWQWAAGSGSDSQPFFRIFNPWLQGEHYDEKCEYIKKWIPELNNSVPVEDIHKWYETYAKHEHTKYPKPMCDYTENKELALKMYKKALY